MFRCYKDSTKTNNSGDLRCHVVCPNLLITVKPGHDRNEAGHRFVSRAMNTERCEV
jgi:formate hydrogenlyase subunit 6/NADH:ubiquinone oxidoreductase subunit I